MTLTATNSGGRTSTGQVTSDAVYGPLGAASIVDVSTVGPFVTFTVRVDANGRPADVAVDIAGGVAGAVHVDDTTGSDTWTRTYTRKVGYGRDLTLAVAFTRGADSVAASTTTGTRGGRVTADAASAAGSDLTLGGRNLSPSTTMRCTVDPAGPGAAVTVTFETDPSGDGSRDIPASEFAATSGTRYTITCDDGVAPATPRQTRWTAP